MDLGLDRRGGAEQEVARPPADLKSSRLFASRWPSPPCQRARCASFRITMPYLRSIKCLRSSESWKIKPVETMAICIGQLAMSSGPRVRMSCP
jgi:hypothetical protein